MKKILVFGILVVISIFFINEVKAVTQVVTWEYDEATGMHCGVIQFDCGGISYGSVCETTWDAWVNSANEMYEVVCG